METLKLGDTGKQVKYLQLACNERGPSRGIAKVHADGVLGPVTIRVVDELGFKLGAHEVTLADPEITVGLQRMIRWPSSRLPVQLFRAAQRKRQAVGPVNPVDSLRERAHLQARGLIGIMESGGNNVGARVEEIIRGGGGQRGQAWCGWFCAHVYRLAGSKAVSWAWGAVRLYLPLSGVKATLHPLQGNLVRYTFDHIGMFVCWCDAHGNPVSRAAATHIKAIEGNTGASGAVSDSTTGGDGVYEKVRALRLVRDYLHITR